MKDRWLINMPKVIHGYRTSRIEVNNLSSILHKKAVEKIAKYFRREFRYDLVQYDAGVNDNNIAFLFIQQQSYKDISNNRWVLPVYGAVCFREKLYKGETNPIWTLDWIWIHPYERNKGILQYNWKYFKERFGEFNIAPPISRSMEGFLKKNGKESIIF